MSDIQRYKLIKVGDIDPFTCFLENTEQSSDGDWVTVRCKKGLWSVTAPDRDTALIEARHYFWQYFADGEYDDTETAVDRLLRLYEKQLRGE